MRVKIASSHPVQRIMGYGKSGGKGVRYKQMALWSTQLNEFTPLTADVFHHVNTSYLGGSGEETPILNVTLAQEANITEIMY